MTEPVPVAATNGVITTDPPGGPGRPPAASAAPGSVWTQGPDVEVSALRERVHELPRTTALIDAHTRIRDRNATRQDFTTHSRRIFRLLLESAIGLLPAAPQSVLTPPGHVFEGLKVTGAVCAVAVVRAGEAFESELWAVAPGMRVGKILIQRDRASKQPQVYYSHLPPDLEGQHVLLLEPMLATGGSLLAALEVLAEAGVPSSRVICVNVLCSRQGLDRVLDLHRELRIVTSSVEPALDADAFMVPGIGDFGDRYFGTDEMRS